MRASTPLLTLALSIALTPVASAQYRWVYSPEAGFHYNNPNSKFLGMMIQNSIKTNIWQSGLLNNPSGRAIQAGRGREVASRPAGNRALFTPRKPPVDTWLMTWSGGDPSKRQALYREYLQQKAIWAAETKARGTHPNNLAEVMATAFVLAYEGQTGSRASAAGYRTMVNEFTTGFAKDIELSITSNDGKNVMAEGAMLDSTDSVMRRRAGNVAGAKAVSAKFLDRWWDEKTAGAVAMLGKRGSTPVAAAPVASAAVPTSAPAGPSVAQALALTNFRRVAPTVLPERLKSMPNGEEASKFARSLIGQVRDKLGSNGMGDVPVDNVARGLTFALMELRDVALSTPGRPVGEGVPTIPRDQAVALRKQLMLNLAASPELRKMSDREKQEMTETLFFLPVFTEVLYEVGGQKGNREAQNAARDAARKAFRIFFGKSPEDIRVG